MKTSRNNPTKPSSSRTMRRRSGNDLLRGRVAPDCCKPSDEATVGQMLDALLQTMSGSADLRDMDDDSIALIIGYGGRVDDLIDTSAEMRGVIFRCYARRISELMLAKGAGAVTGPCIPSRRRLY